MDNNKVIGSMNDRFVYVHKYMAMSGIDFANALGIAAAIVSSIETGKREPSKDVLIRLAEKFGVNLHWLLTGEGEMLINAPKPEVKAPDVKEAIGCLVDEQVAPKLSEIESRMAKQESRIAKLEALAQRQEAPPPLLYEIKGVEESSVGESEAEYEEEEDMERALYVRDIAAGLPIEQTEDLTESRMVPARLIKTSARDYYTARIRGESMTGAGIPDGCVALIRLADAPRDGAIQVVRRESKSTLKRMAELPGGGWRLLYEDGTGRYIDLSDTEWRVQGDFVAVVEG
jgi:SOS-response transcriptional repressor LexA